MSDSKKYNNFSDKLLKQLPKLKPGEKIKFQLNGVRPDKQTGKMICPNSFSLRPFDRIFDPYAGENGEYVDVAYILGEAPAPVDSNKQSITRFGRVRFTRTTAGTIEIIGGHKEMEKMLPLLFFSNYNQSNVGKPWYVKPEGKHVFHQIETTKKAKDDLATQKRKHQAKSLVMDMDEGQVHEISSGLFPNTYHAMSNEERTLQLIKIAEKTPEKILDLDKNVEVKSTAFIEECLKAGIININKTKQQFEWADDKTKICSIKPGQTPHNSLKRYFMTDEGMEVLEGLEKQLAIAKKPKKDKTEKAEV